jgi:fermentation-respiration switch protein FrsA (DUF1100 family)
MTWIKWLVGGALIYGAFAGFMYFTQRKLMYFPETLRTLPETTGLPQAEEMILSTSDGEKLIAWHIAPAEGRPVVVYYHGNGGSLRLRAERFRVLTSGGIGLLALSYRGYGGSTGSPSETGLLLDGVAAHTFAAQRYGADRVVLWGESLGCAVAVAVAAEKPVARVILESPFTSAADIAASIYWFLPVRLLIKDPFPSDQRVGKITASVLVIHGEKDRVVPIRFGESLYDLIKAPKKFLRLRDADHNDHDEYGGVEMVVKYLDEPISAAPARSQ